ncbi:hypothetical protein FOE33_24415 [Salmonella enterica]|nr:hypothetical protein [Salmonella enterica]ECH4042285.1 hypothetical protein [Salmonella enterica]
MADKLITCPHCRSEIPHGANVCRGCQAEISYGTSGFMMLVLLICPLVIAAFLSSLLDAVGFSKLPNIKLTIEICACIAMWIYGIKWSQRKYKDRIRFERVKNK